MVAGVWLAAHLYADQIHQFRAADLRNQPSEFQVKGLGKPRESGLALPAGTCASFHPANPLNHAGFNYIRPGPVPKLGLGVTGSGGLLT